MQIAVLFATTSPTKPVAAAVWDADGKQGSMGHREVAEAYLRYYPAIAAKCERMVRSRAEAQDLAQETFVRLWTERASLRDAQAVLAWSYRTATRLAIDHLRRQDVAQRAAGLTPAVATEERRRLEAREQLAAVARQVGKRELEALILSRLDGLSHAEIASVLDSSERTIRRLLKRAEGQLARAQRRT